MSLRLSPKEQEICTEPLFRFRSIKSNDFAALPQELLHSEEYSNHKVRSCVSGFLRLRFARYQCYQPL